MKSLVLMLLMLAPASSRQQPQIISQRYEINPDGSFSYSYQTEDGISARAQGVLKNAGQAGLEAQSITGEFSYTAPDGTQYIVSYVSDERGYQPRTILKSPRSPDATAVTGEKFIQPRTRFPS